MVKLDRPQISLFEPREDTGKWKPPSVSELPLIKSRGIKRIYLDAETTGKSKFKDVPVGWSVNGQYFPFAHIGGGNLDEEQVKRWAKDEIRDCTIVNINTGFDSEVSRNWGVDFEEQGCVLHDVAHSASLINENRWKGVNLDELSKEMGGPGKVECPVEPKNIHRVHSSLVGPYAEGDTKRVEEVDCAQRPLIDADELNQVEALEDELIWANNHMERNGMPLDMPKLDGWLKRLDEDYSDRAIKIWTETGVKMKPNTQASWGQLFDKLGLDRNKTGEWVQRGNKEVEQESYTDEVLKGIDNPLVRDALRMRRLSSLKSKYLEKYKKAQTGGILPFNLYQLRAAEEDYGTVVGRYSSANVNIQQVFKVTNQYEHFCDCGCPKKDREHVENHKLDCVGVMYVIRELMIEPDPGMDMFAVDGSQLQFRLFAHYSNDRTLIDAYRNDPNVDFHMLVATLFEMSRQAAKHNNFAKVLGMGNEKLANRSGNSCKCKPEAWWSRETRYGLSREEYRQHIFAVNSNHTHDCPARISNDMSARYDAQFPAAKKLMELITRIAEERGYIKTLLGRRRRYKKGDKFYSAFAGLLQGSEADMVKSKINQLYRNRKLLNILMRCPVHDEIVGGIAKGEVYRRRFEECCAEATIPLKVPMIWNAGYGHNWKETK